VPHHVEPETAGPIRRPVEIPKGGPPQGSASSAFAAESRIVAEEAQIAAAAERGAVSLSFLAKAGMVANFLGEAANVAAVFSLSSRRWRRPRKS